MSAPDKPDDDERPEPRVKDVLPHAPEADESLAVTDPLLAAKLMEWFSLPSFDDLAEKGIDPATASSGPAARSAPSVELSKQELRAQTLATALANVSPAMVAWVERHVAAGDHLRSLPPPPHLLGERPFGAIDEALIPPPIDLDDLPEVQVPPPLLRDLKICTPQASLRDLHRPEKDFFITMRPPWDDDADEEPPPADPMEPVRAALRTRYRVGTVAPATTTYGEGLRDLRDILARPWAESKRERARNREAELLRKEAEAAGVTGQEGTP